MADGALLQDEQKIDGEFQSSEGDGGCCKCMDRCCDCLGRIPCASTLALTLLLSGLAGFAASVIVAVQQTRDAFKSLDKPLTGGNLLSTSHLGPIPLPLIETVVLSICVGMVLLSCIFLSIAFLSSGATRRHLFGGRKSHNICGRVTNGIMFGLGYIVNVAWVALSGLFAIPVFILAILINKCGDGSVANGGGETACFTPADYAITAATDPNGTKIEFCGDNFRKVCQYGNDALPAYIAAYVSSVVVVISTIHFLVTITANYAHIKKDGGSGWHGGSEDYVGSTNTIENTKM
jgi:hypothetical protein